MRFALERSRHLYAHAAAGPEYEYPACLDCIRRKSLVARDVDLLTHGAMITLAPGIGSCFPSISPATWPSH